MKSSEIRERFLSYFESQGHRRVSSVPLLPSDPNLLFNIAGMVPFKPYFLGNEQPPHTRLTSSQKCLRTEDIDQVGFTARHQTFFEMLGNFSFGDYFKEGAIGFAWDFFINELELEPERLYVSVFGGDECEGLEPDVEAKQLWLDQTSIPSERILELGTKENFWKMGPTGPCGPCSEILYDQGDDELPPGQVKQSVLAGEDRYLELWNLVFIQFNRADDGSLSTLPKQNIDTGMGLERLSAILQGANHNFDTDLFRPVIDRTREKAGLPPLEQGKPAELNGEPGMLRFEETDISVQQAIENQRAGRIIADHMRAASFLLSEGLIPGNEGRGYILRRLIRRSLRWGRKLGFEEPFLHELVGELSSGMGDAYPELVENRSLIEKRLRQEEEQFLKTLERGMQELQVRIDQHQSDHEPHMDGEEVFELYETYGFPVEMTEEILEEQGIGYDSEEIREAREKHREQSSGSWDREEEFEDLDLSDCSATEFVGYEKMSCQASVEALFREGESVDLLKPGDTGRVVIDETPFYAEGGGQVGDRGTIGSFRVDDTQSHGKITVHYGEAEGTIEIDETVTAQVDRSARRDTMRHHTATHLLQSALREELGEEVMQNGSLVDEEHLRFDFTYNERVPRETLDKIEQRINGWIYQEYPVSASVMKREEAEKKGALAFFGEHYGEEVRVVEIGDISTEFCGGTHLQNSSELGLFTITDESSVAAGVRRIVAHAGRPALNALLSRRDQLREITREAGVQSPSDVVRRIRDLRETRDALEQELGSLRSQQSAEIADELAAGAESIGNYRCVLKTFSDRDTDALKTMVDEIKNELESGIVLLINEQGQSVQLLLGVTDDLTDDIHAGNWVGELASLVGGGGGGRPDFAQAGGSDVSGIEQVIERFRERLSEKATV